MYNSTKIEYFYPKSLWYTLITNINQYIKLFYIIYTLFKIKFKSFAFFLYNIYHIYNIKIEWHKLINKLKFIQSNIIKKSIYQNILNLSIKTNSNVT